MQEDERGDVAGQAEELANDHEPVPRLNGERHHQQLRQDEGGEGNSHDVDELRLEEQQRPVHDDASCRGEMKGEWMNTELIRNQWRGGLQSTAHWKRHIKDMHDCVFSIERHPHESNSVLVKFRRLVTQFSRLYTCI